MAKRFRKLPKQTVLIFLLILGLLLFRTQDQRQNFIKNDSDFHRDLAKQPKGTKWQKSPFAEVENLGNGELRMETSGLPKTKADLTPLDPTWHKRWGKWIAGENLFFAEINGNKVHIAVGNDQPFKNIKQGDDVTYAPQLSVGGKEYKALKGPVVLAVDPMNKNYHNNVLEWDYGVAKRRLRIIEGNIQGSWVFSQDPKAEVRIKYNQQGKLALNLGGSSSVVEKGTTPIKVAVVNNDEEVVTIEQWNNLAISQYPVSIADSATYYPDAHTESTSVDGTAHSYMSTTSWSTARGVAANAVADAGVSGDIAGNRTMECEDYTGVNHAIYLFDTSALSDTATITAATLSIYGSGKEDNSGTPGNPNIYSATTASNTALTAGDSFGTTAFSTTITYANWKTTSPFWNDFVLNASGIAVISLTGISKFSVRDATYDVGGSTPGFYCGDQSETAFSGVSGYFSEQGTGYQPKLVVTYTVPNSAPTNDSLTFTNPYTGGSNNAVADNTTEWNFRAVVSDTDGYANLGTVVLRLANSSDNTTPFDSLKYTWTEATDAFSETADTQSAAAITSTNADSTCATNTCTLDFKIKFNSSFSTQSTNYNAELYTTDDAAATDSDSYASFYQVVPISISITSPSDVSLGTITGTGTSSTGEATWTVTTNNPSGYKLEWQASSATMANEYSDTIAAYTPAVADTPETWSVATTDSEWGGRLKSTSTDYASATWGADDTTNAKWLNTKSSALFQIASRASVTTGSNQIVQFKAEIGSSKFQPTGAYTVNVTLTATTL